MAPHADPASNLDVHAITELISRTCESIFDQKAAIRAEIDSNVDPKVEALISGKLDHQRQLLEAAATSLLDGRCASIERRVDAVENKVSQTDTNAATDEKLAASLAQATSEFDDKVRSNNLQLAADIAAKVDDQISAKIAASINLASADPSAEVGSRVSQLEVAKGSLEGLIAALQAKVVTVEASVGHIDGRLDEKVDAKIESLNPRNIVPVVEVALGEKLMGELEAKQSSHDNAFAALAARVDSMGTLVDGLNIQEAATEMESTIGGRLMASLEERLAPIARSMDHVVDEIIPELRERIKYLEEALLDEDDDEESEFDVGSPQQMQWANEDEKKGDINSSGRAEGRERSLDDSKRASTSDTSHPSSTTNSTVNAPDGVASTEAAR